MQGDSERVYDELSSDQAVRELTDEISCPSQKRRHGRYGGASTWTPWLRRSRSRGQATRRGCKGRPTCRRWPCARLPGRLHDGQRLLPSNPDAGEPSPETAVDRAQPRSSLAHGALEHADLVTKSEILQRQVTLGHEERAGGYEEGSDQIEHGWGTSPHLPELFKDHATDEYLASTLLDSDGQPLDPKRQVLGGKVRAAGGGMPGRGVAPPFVLGWRAPGLRSAVAHRRRRSASALANVTYPSDRT
jgi:hypothetical protein